MGFILSIESATKVGSVALHHEGKLVATSLLARDNSHSNSLALMAQQLLVHAQVQPAQLSAVAVSAGPGSYTGLRIGWSIAKGICFANGLPFITIPTLKILAAAALPVQEDVILMPCIDARRMEIYQAKFDSQLAQLAPTHAAIITTVAELEAHAQPGRTLLLCGDGAGKYASLAQQVAGVQICDTVTAPDARFMGTLAWQQFLANDFADLAYAVPEYVKEPNLS